MGIDKEIRLFKVANELSVGVNTIVDFLKKKGFDVSGNPNTKITPRQYELLQREYASDQMAKKLSEKEAEKEKERKKAINAENKANKSSNTNQVPADKKEVKVLDQNQKSNNNRQQNQQKQKQRSQEPTLPKVLGKIDLNALNTKTRPDKKQPGQDRNKQQQQQQQQQRNDGSQQPKPVVQNQQPAAQPAAPTTTPQTPKPAENSEPEVFRPGSVTLTGPRIIGKIELTDESKKSGKKKRRRRRIDKERVDINDTTAQQSGRRERRDGPQKNRNGVNGGGNNNGNAGGNNNAAGNNGNANNKDNNNSSSSRRSQERRRNRDKHQPQSQDVIVEDANRNVKETLAQLLKGKGKNKAALRRHDKRVEDRHRLEEERELEELEKKTLQVTEFVSANELASLMDVPVSKIISTCFDLGTVIAINQRLDADIISLVAEEYGFDVEFIGDDNEEGKKKEVVEDNPEDLQPRAPIVVVMGHVDHGKTKLLDYIRNTNVISGEAGGITQAIGAYNVTLPDGNHITFLDTPGHQAFTAMRARGAKITDIAVIVVAADSTVMPQTEEAIAHAQAAGVPIVFAITKVDLPTANVEKIKEELAKRNFLVEDWGGKYGSVEISAMTGYNVDKLLERIQLEAEMLELRANFNCKAEGTVVESTLDKGRGYMATVLVERGTLKIGDVLWAGAHSGKVKAMFNERGKNIYEVKPAEPASVLGLDGPPVAGDRFEVMDDERSARERALRRAQLEREIGVRTKKHLTLEEIGRRIKLGNFHELNIIIKGDVQGSVEAVQDSLEKLSTEEIQVNIIGKGVGQISENDIMLASASNAIIIGFDVRPSASAKKLADKEQIDIKLYSIIYDAIDAVKHAMEGLLAPKTKEEEFGVAEVKSVFRIAKVGNIAGCLVTSGKVLRTNSCRVVRDGVVIHKGKVAALKHYKDDVKEVAMGMECGVDLEKFHEYQVGDILEAYEEKEVARTLDEE